MKLGFCHSWRTVQKATIKMRYSIAANNSGNHNEAAKNAEPLCWVSQIGQNDGPLKGVRVLDFSRVLAGPYCSMVLGDLGAEVIKIEKAGEGDDTRKWGPPFTAAGESAYFLCINRNKKSITLNLKKPEGIQIALELAKKCDVILENFLPGTAEKLGLGYEDLKKVNESIIYASISGFGTTGPYVNRPGYDVMVSAMGGLMSITGEQDGPPVKVGVALTDITTGLFAHGAIAAALYSRTKTGKGQKIELSLLESEIATLPCMPANMGVLTNNHLTIAKRWGTAHESIVPYQGFEAKDGWVVLGAGNEQQWERLCTLMKQPELAKDPRYNTNKERVKRRKEVVETVQNFIRTKTKNEMISSCEQYKIPCCPINNMKEVFEDPQVLARQMLIETEHASGEKIKMTGLPVKYSGTKPGVKCPPPLLGQHTDEILSSLLCYTPEKINWLRENGIV